MGVLPPRLPRQRPEAALGEQQGLQGRSFSWRGQHSCFAGAWSYGACLQCDEVVELFVPLGPMQWHQVLLLGPLYEKPISGGRRFKLSTLADASPLPAMVQKPWGCSRLQEDVRREGYQLSLLGTLLASFEQAKYGSR